MFSLEDDAKESVSVVDIVFHVKIINQMEIFDQYQAYSR